MLVLGAWVAALAVVAAVVWSGSAAALGGGPDAFSDDDFVYYETPLNALARRGVLAGTQCSPGRICPDDLVTRATAAVWLGRAVTGSEPAGGMPVRFVDVDPDDWRAVHVERLARLGITRGCSVYVPRFCPDKIVTRGQMAALLARAFKLPEGPPAGFGDIEGHHFASDIDSLAAAGISSGCSADPLRFCPNEPVTRGQMATFIARALGLDKPPPDQPDDGEDADGEGWLVPGGPDDLGALNGTDEEAPDADPATAPYGYGPLTFEEALDTARRLAPEFAAPVDCRRPPLDSSILMPNAPRHYRSGIHKGVDFFCGRGHPVKAVLDGRVTIAAGRYEDATLADLNALLAIAGALKATPAFTLLTLNGNYVAIDHGIIEGVGHVATLYVHLDAVHPGLRVGQPVNKGTLLGGVGNTGTVAAASGDPHRSLHLHWEIHVNGRYLAEGLSRSDTRAVYAALFGLDNP